MVHVIQCCFKLALLIMFYIATFCLLYLKKKNTGQAVKTSIKKITRTNKKMKGTKKRKFAKKRKNQPYVDFHDQSITFLQGNISQYTRKLYEMKSSLSEGTK